MKTNDPTVRKRMKWTIDITERPISKEIGIPPESKMYIGVKVMQKNKADDEDYINKHNQAVKMLKQMIEFE